MSNPTFIHHPACYKQDTNEGHEDGVCADGTLAGRTTFEEWPKVVPAAQDPQMAEHPAGAGLPQQGQGPAPALGVQRPEQVSPFPNTGEATSASNWRKSVQTTDLRVPSGNICKAKKPSGLGHFLKAGSVPNSLMPIIQKHMNDKIEVDLEKLGKEVLDDPAKIADMLVMMDTVVLATVEQPVVLPVPKFTERDAQAGVIPPGMDIGDVVPESLRDPDCLYVDEVDMEDKTFIFQWAMGGTRDLERFREQQTQGLEALPTVEGMGAEA